MKKFEFLSKIKQFFTKLYGLNKKLFFAILAVFVLVVCMVGFSFFNTSKTKTKTQNNALNLSHNDYAGVIENKIKNILLSMSAVSEVEVFVMVDSTPKKNYLTEIEESKTTSEKETTETKKETVVFEKDGSASAPIELSITLPKISGVLIFLNKIDSSTKVSIVTALSVVLNIDESCISILQDR